jgi:hypothetical protein
MEPDEFKEVPIVQFFITGLISWIIGLSLLYVAYHVLRDVHNHAVNPVPTKSER